MLYSEYSSLRNNEPSELRNVTSVLVRPTPHLSHRASSRGGISGHLWVGMCRWANENWSIHLPNSDPKLDPCIYRRSKVDNQDSMEMELRIKVNIRGCRPRKHDTTSSDNMLIWSVHASWKAQKYDQNFATEYWDLLIFKHVPAPFFSSSDF